MAVGIYLACLLIAGYGAALLLIRDRSRLELFGMAACLGPGIVGLTLIAFSMCGARPSILIVAILTALLGILALVRKIPPSPLARSGPPEAKRFTPAERWWTFFCISLLACAAIVTIWNAFVNPTFEWDAFSIWQLKAKVLYLQSLTPRPDYFSDISMSYSHLRYPLLVPMVSAGVHAFTGNFRDESGQSAFLISYFSLGAVIYAALRDRRGPIPAITATTLLLTLPLLMRFATSGTAEMALDSFYACSLVCILNYQEKQRLSDLILLAIFSILMTWTKNEGIAIAAINVTAILLLTPRPLSRKNITAAFSLLFSIALFYTPWLIWTHGLPRTDEDYAGHLTLTETLGHLNRIPTILMGFINEMLLKENMLGAIKEWGVFWIILALLAITQFKRLKSRPVYTLWICALLHAAAYVLVYIITPLKLSELIGDSMDRLILHLTPAAALILGMLWPSRPETDPTQTVTASA